MITGFARLKAPHVRGPQVGFLGLEVSHSYGTPPSTFEHKAPAVTDTSHLYKAHHRLGSPRVQEDSCLIMKAATVSFGHAVAGPRSWIASQFPHLEVTVSQWARSSLWISSDPTASFTRNARPHLQFGTKFWQSHGTKMSGATVPRSPRYKKFPDASSGVLDLTSEAIAVQMLDTARSVRTSRMLACIT